MSLGTTENLGAFAQLSAPAALDVLDFLDPQSLVMFSCTCRAAHALAAHAKVRNADWQRCVVDGDYQRACCLDILGLALEVAPAYIRETLACSAYADACATKNGARVAFLSDRHRVDDAITREVGRIVRSGTLADLEWVAEHSGTKARNCWRASMMLGGTYGRLDVVQWVADCADADDANNAFVMACARGHADVALWIAERWAIPADRVNAHLSFARSLAARRAAPRAPGPDA